MTKELDVIKESLADLRRSGLADSSISKMQIRPATLSDSPALTSLRATGYVIPYFVPLENSSSVDEGYKVLQVEETPFTRVKVLYPEEAEEGAKRPKYLQRANTGTHLYFPPLVPGDHWWDTSKPLWITEGEKKAACVTQTGRLCVGLGGIDSWRSRKVRVPMDAVKATSGTTAIIEMDELTEARWETAVAEELMWLPLERRKVYLCYDSEELAMKKMSVQRALFDFCIWLETQGAEPYQVVIPGGSKGIDDYLVTVPLQSRASALAKMEKEARFPRRPNMKSWVSRKLSAAKTGRSRSTLSSVARAIVSDLDHTGVRYKDPFGTYYYFHSATDVLYSLPREGSALNTIAQTAPEFHHQLVRNYGVSAADRELLTRFTDAFQALPPIMDVNQIYKQSHATTDAVYYQLTDSTVAKITASDVVVVPNGTDGVLFEAGCVPCELLDEHDIPNINWLSTLRETSLLPLQGADISPEDTRVLVAGLFYLSPWLRRWRGLMLPAELAVSEAGSGKTSLYQLRQGIFSGVLALRNAPEDMRSWYASIADARGIWIADNVGGKIDAKLSNEMARIITDPDPAFELRQLYTTAQVMRVPIDCVFAFTGIYNPFHKPDILQRSVVLQFDSIRQKDGSWLRRHYHDIGRDAWVSHHLYIIRDFLAASKGISWGVSTAHRLTGFEQSLRCIAKVMKQEAAMNRALAALPAMTTARITEAEPVLEALAAFTRTFTGSGKIATFTSIDIVSWAKGVDNFERYGDIRILKNGRLLDKYILAHSADVASVAGIRRKGTDPRTEAVTYEATLGV